MKTKHTFFITIFAGLIIMAGCGKDSATGPDDFTGISTISGKLVAPDGSTPISEATIYVPSGSPKTLSTIRQIASNDQADMQTRQASCAEPPEVSLAKTCTEADGSFQFDVEVEAGQLTLKVKKGVFSFETTLEISGAQAKIGTVAMPSGSENLETRMAVVTGPYDRMQDILTKLGFGELDEIGQLELGTEQFDLYNGDFSLPESYPDFLELFEDRDGDGQSDLNNYDIVFINCGADESFLEEPNFKGGSLRSIHQHGKELSEKKRYSLLDQSDIDALRDYVQNGGTLYATDLAYDFVEQPFPSFLDFYGSQDVTATDVEYQNEAETGEDGITTDASILQDGLRNWLQNVSCDDSCINGDGTIHIEGFLSGWGVMEGAHAGADVISWVEGVVSWYDYDTFELRSGTKPLTASFTTGSGKVVYSSYHTVEEEPGPGWKPQERILQYLVFE